MMSQQYPEMFQEYPPNRSPATSRAYGNMTLNRQTSRQFMDNYQTPLQNGGLYGSDDASQYNGNQAGYRGPSNNINYAYESQTWNYGGANAASTMGAAGRMRPQQQTRRNEIPSVSYPFINSPSAFAQFQTKLTSYIGLDEFRSFFPQWFHASNKLATT